MKTAIALTCFVLYALISRASVEMKSFYFKSNSCELQSNSKEELESLKQELQAYKVQFIEFNAFTERSQFIKNDKELAQKRINLFLDELDAEDQQVSLNAFGDERIKLDFNPFNWERIDIYYIKEKNPSDAFTNYIGATQNSVKNFTASEKSKTAFSPESAKNGSMNLHLNFLPGKAEIHSSSKDNLDSLLLIMSNNPELKANIRGHVCCGDKMRISKKRAKKVYQYLVDNGIDKKRLSFEGLSNSEPLVYPELTEEDRKLNRRVEVVFTDDSSENTLAEN